MNTYYKKYATIQWKGKQSSSLLNKSSHNNVSIAKWDQDIWGQPPSQLPHYPSEHEWPIQVHYFAEIIFSVNEVVENTKKAAFAFASRCLPHIDRYKIGS